MGVAQTLSYHNCVQPSALVTRYVDLDFESGNELLKLCGTQQSMDFEHSSQRCRANYLCALDKKLQMPNIVN